MTETQYGHLIKTLSYRKGFMGKANAKLMTMMHGKDLEGFNLNFIIGVFDEIGDWAPNRGAHVHPFDEFLFFFGYDPQDLSYLGSDLELAMGKEREKHYFSVPMVVAVPKDLPHCPLLTKKVYQPFGHFHLALSPVAGGSHVEQEGITDGNKYTSLFKTLAIKQGSGAGNAAQYWSVSAGDLAGLPANVAMGLYNEPGQLSSEEGTHTHPYDECLIFFGHKTAEPTYLGAELSIDLGGEHEKHSFSVSTAVVIPQGTPHSPVVCNRVDSPYRFVRIGLAAEYTRQPAA
jgi:hypothetical protein